MWDNNILIHLACQDDDDEIVQCYIGALRVAAAFLALVLMSAGVVTQLINHCRGFKTSTAHSGI